MFGASSLLAVSAMLLLSACLSLFLGSVVLYHNSDKRSHRAFALLTLNLAVWAVGVLCIVHSHTPGVAEFWVKATFIVASFLPAMFYQFIAFFPHQRFEGVRAYQKFLYAAAIALSLGTFTPWYLLAPPETFAHQPPVVHYGPVFGAYSLLVAITMLAMFRNLFRKLRRSVGVQRRQVQHVLFFIFLSIGFATLTNLLAPVLNIQNTELYGPCFMVLMMGGLAYSMVRYHLLDIWAVISRTTVYAVITACVILIFTATVSVVHRLFVDVTNEREWLTTVLAAVIVSLVLQPLKERIQLLLDRIVVHRRYNSEQLIERITRRSASIVHLDQFLVAVSKDLQQTMGIRLIRVLLVCEKESDCLITRYSTQESEQDARTIDMGYLINYLERHNDPISGEHLLHSRPTEQKARVASILVELGAQLLVPLRTKETLVGILLLGDKDSRDMYTPEDIKVFATLAGPLATTMENARLYSKLDELNLHLERILSSMRGGVVAVDVEGTITTINQEARSMLGEPEAGQAFSVLDPKVAQLLRKTLQERRGIRDYEITLPGEDGEEMPVAISSAYFTTGDNQSDGAMVLIYNMSQIKRLESSVQRADRLTSIGTMAAGMAHEIKNPLVSIKTFSQLLLERFDDSDFRKTFAEVVPPEVQRIDTIVTRLLDFARPRPVCFAPQNLRTIINEVLALVENQTRHYDIRVVTEFPDVIQEVTADDQQLHQVFLNLMLNAIDAVKDVRNRVLRVRMYYDRTHIPRVMQTPMLDVPCVKIVVSDTGVGIPAENVRQLFTPFFTTKSYGTGLGLSVVHGIITEHGADIEVTSIPGVETSFIVTFPLVDKAQLAERVRA